MKIALYSRTPDHNGIQFITQVIHFLHQENVEVWLFENLKKDIPSSELDDIQGVFSNSQQLTKQSVNCLFSIGGDGTFIDAAKLIADSQIPILGINTGRIGFLTGINKTNFQESFYGLQKGEYTIDNRALLHVDADSDLQFPSSFALNDVSIHPYSEDSILAIHVWANGEKVNTYWSDGLIVATPTGSTAYSLSCGGPILHPSAQVHVITPISSHTLAVRPIIVPDSAHIRLVPSDDEFNLSMDSCSCILPGNTEINLAREDFTIRLVRMNNQSFFTAIHEKLAWGTGLR